MLDIWVPDINPDINSHYTYVLIFYLVSTEGIEVGMY